MKINTLTILAKATRVLQTTKVSRFRFFYKKLKDIILTRSDLIYELKLA